MALTGLFVPIRLTAAVCTTRVQHGHDECRTHLAGELEREALERLGAIQRVPADATHVLGTGECAGHTISDANSFR